ncbi:MAG: META domain-containing protein [Alistipes sp.]|nr:META domain-containing protein [Alistipes senegalensis]MCM1249958.1 META domain-containing protein [Alistipes sp.]
MKKFFAAAALLAAMTACGGAANDKPLEGTVWKLSAMEGIPASAIGSEEDAFTLSFDGEEMMVAGRTNCNRFFSNYEAIDGTLAFGDMGMTRMACPDMEFEDAFVQMLGRVDGFAIDGDRLTLFGDGETLASFEAIELPQDEE